MGLLSCVHNQLGTGNYVAIDARKKFGIDCLGLAAHLPQESPQIRLPVHSLRQASQFGGN